MPPYSLLQQRHYHSTFPLPRDKTDNEHYFLNICFLIDVSTLSPLPHLLILSLPSSKHPLRLSSEASFIAHDNSHHTYIDLQLISCLAAGLVANSCCSAASCSPIRPFPSILYDVSNKHLHQPEHSNIATILYLSFRTHGTQRIPYSSRRRLSPTNRASRLLRKIRLSLPAKIN